MRELDSDCALAESILDRLLLIDIEVQKSKQVVGLKFFATELSEIDKKRLVEGGARGMSTFMSYYILKAVASFDKPMAIQMMKDYYGAMLDKGATSFWEDFDMDWIEGSSRIYNTPTSAEPSWVARRMRCASPPERVPTVLNTSSPENRKAPKRSRALWGVHFFS